MAEFIVGIFYLVLLTALIGLYLLPTIVAHNRKHADRFAITILNIVGGWLIIGWIIALVWACTNNIKKETSIAY